MSLTQSKETWEIMAQSWADHIKPPSRPCPTQLKIWEKVISEIRNKNEQPKAFLLGSTPEFRDLLANYDFEVTVCDLNEGMIMAMRNLMKFNPKNEKHLVSNWLEADVPENHFDLVIGDAALNQILDLNDFINFLKKINKILKKNGYYLMREIVAVETEKQVRPEYLESLFTAWGKGELTNMELFNYLKYSSYINPCEASPTIVDSYNVYKELQKICQDELKQKFLKWYEQMHAGAHKYMMMFSREHLESLLKKNFEIVPIEQCPDYHFCRTQMPAYLLKKK